ncbi:hypothetical protein [Bradyrhizobium sp. USDA 4353]
MNDGFSYSIDLSLAQSRAEKIIECIKRWQAEHDLRPFEYTNHLRVSPTSIPRSHPTLTLNAELYDPSEILCEYLREQMHWYLTRLKSADDGSPLIAELKRRYPAAPVGFPEGANDEYSTYQHLLVNWLEIEVTSPFAGRERVEEIARNKRYYRWMYRTVLADWRPLEELYRNYGIVPIKPAGQLAD